MKKLKTFLYVFKNSVTSTKYYNDILKTDFWFSLKYFLMLSFFASLIFSAFSSITVIPETISGIKSLAENTRKVYPEDLVINFKEGTWETNKEDPVIIPMPDLEEESKEYLPDNLVLFDKNGTIDKLDEFNTLFLFNNENIIYKNDGNAVTSQPLDFIPDLTLDAKTINSGIDKIYKYLKVLPYVLPLFILIFTFLFNYLGGVLFNVLFIAIILYLVSLVAKVKIPFISTLKICIHAVTIPVLLQLVLIPFPQINSYLPGWFGIFTLIISIYFMFKMREEADFKKLDK